MTAVVAGGDHRDEQSVLEARARSLARPVEEERITGGEHLVVRVGPQRFAIPAERTRHVAGPRPITPAPAESGAIVGVAAVLGQVVATVDLGAVLRVPSAVAPGQRHLVLLDEAADCVALLVDAVERLEVLTERADAPADTLGEMTSDAVVGPRVLDLDALLDDLEPSSPRPAHLPGGAP